MTQQNIIPPEEIPYFDRDLDADIHQGIMVICPGSREDHQCGGCAHRIPHIEKNSCKVPCVARAEEPDNFCPDCVPIAAPDALDSDLFEI